MTAGIPQGSVLGPILWNTLYDDVLRLKLPAGVTAIAYADDLALCAAGRTPEELEVKINGAILNVESWIPRTGLTLAADKTEAVCLAGRKRVRPLDIRVEGNRVTTKPEIKYLGVFLHTKMTFRPHIEKQIRREHQTTEAIKRLLPRYKGPSEHKRRL